MERTNGKTLYLDTHFAQDMKEKKMATKKNKCLYTKDDRGNTGTLSGNGVQNFVPLCQRYKKNMAKH
jgi:hypothetical protein